LSNASAVQLRRALRATFPLLLAAACAFAMPARGADAPPAKPPDPAKPDPAKPGGAGGDGGAKPKAASMIIEESSSASEAAPPPPVGEEKKLIGEYIISHTEDVRDCYQKRIQERPTLQGKLVARFDIGPSGRVIGATADGIGDAQLVACVVGVVRKWEFEKPAAGGKLRIAFPFKLTPEAAK
jgi:hypothetical protein